MSEIIYTKTDEAPLLATYALLPIIKSFASNADINFKTVDISLAGRILAQFNDSLPENQKTCDGLSYLGDLVNQKDANILKLPNISASIPQLKAAIKELQEKGYNIPNYPDNPSNDEEKAVKAKYDAVKGSAVNPVLRQGNSDRRVPLAVKEATKQNPHSVGAWSGTSKTKVITMGENDFKSNEISYTLTDNSDASIVFTGKDGSKKVLKESLPLKKGEIIDATYMSVKALEAFLDKAYNIAKDEGLIFSAHLKATMMKVSDPVIFGYVVKSYFKNTYLNNADILKNASVKADDGLKAAEALGDANILADIKKDYEKGPRLYAVNSDKGISNLHVPSDVIIDASLPALIRNGGISWDMSGKEGDTLVIIPDSSYAGVYNETIKDAVKNGKFDPKTVGTVANVGLMAKKAEEYGSHDKTFIAEGDGKIEIVLSDGNVILSLDVEKGDIFRACQTKDESVKDWVALAVKRAKLSNTPVIFWLDENRAHDNSLIQKVNAYLSDLDTDGLEISILSPEEATKATLKRFRAGLDTISATGNVLRDYLTDLFPILEVGTSAKTLSIVPLLAGGGLYETGSGGSAPKHVQQFLEENHLRWDSLGEYLAIVESLRSYGLDNNNSDSCILADALEKATCDYLNNNKAPSRSTGEIDNRGSHFYICLYWAKALSQQTENDNLKTKFLDIYNKLQENESAILNDLIECQGKSVDLGGYYILDDIKSAAALRPSSILNDIVEKIAK